MHHKPGLATDRVDRKRASGSPIRVMIVDDSLTTRAVLAKIISGEPDIDIVAKTSSAELALQYLAREPVDVVLLDLEMPGMGGLDALPKILASPWGIKVLVVSSLTEIGAEHTLAALSMGAADTMLKPRSGQFDEYYRRQLLRHIRALGRGRKKEDGASPASNTPVPPLQSRPAPPGQSRLLGLGASTGGIHALCVLLKHIPTEIDLPILVTQHLPDSFLDVFARQLELASGRPAVVVEQSEAIEPGRIHIAPGGFHLVVRNRGEQLIAQTASGTVDSGCLPSVDPMFSSMAACVGPGALGVVLSGMGRDGTKGARELVGRGGLLLAQDEESSAVWGMPGSVATAGLASAILPPAELAAKITTLARVATWK